jgi:subtilisin
MSEQGAAESGHPEHILLPVEGFRFRESLDARRVADLFAPHLPAGAEPPQVVATIPRSGPMLVRAHPEAAARLAAQPRDVRLVPVVSYRPAWVRRTAAPAPRPDAKHSVTLRVISARDGSAVAGADVAAIVDLATGQGLAGVTDAQGRVTLELTSSDETFAAFFTTPQSTFWSYLARDFEPVDGMEIAVRPIDLAFVDALRHFYGQALITTGEGVKVGVVDTGVGPHPDLDLAGGRNCVTGEDPENYGDNGLGHGTHVAGIIAARGAPRRGVRGLAPAVSLFSYRVYAQGAGTSSNFAIAMAIEQAIADGCDLVNLSLSLDQSDDEAVHEAIDEARSRGSLLLGASGNTTFGPRGPVSYPASDPGCLAISAMGRNGFFPADTLEVGEVLAPFGADPDNFVARFSNVGPRIALTGPGVGIISTFPGGYAVEDGTSMACPAVCGRAAVLLSASSTILEMPRKQERSDAIAQLITADARRLGFGESFEGHGLP